MNPPHVEASPAVVLVDGFPDVDRLEIARLYWAAFGSKLGVALNPPETAIGMLAEVIDPAAAIVARGGDGALLGVAGYKTPEASFVAIDFGSLRRFYGLLGALWRGALLSCLERRPESGSLLMDGIVVAERARGRGVGAALLEAVKHKAHEMGRAQVRLDVIDANPRARKLYAREGFRVARVRSLGPLRHLFGFRSAATMAADSAPADGEPFRLRQPACRSDVA